MSALTDKRPVTPLSSNADDDRTRGRGECFLARGGQG
jgi:hypothetical protein